MIRRVALIVAASACAPLFWGCVHTRVNRVDAKMTFVPISTQLDCAIEVTDNDLRHPISFVIGGTRFYVHTGDEPWRVAILDEPQAYRTGYVWGPRLERRYAPFGERRGFEATLICGATQRELDGLECATKDGLVLYVAGQEIGWAGSADEPCQLRIEMRDGAREWLYVEDNVLVRSGLRERFFE